MGPRAMKKLNPLLNVLIRVEDARPHSIAAVVYAHGPSPITPYYPSIFLTPSSYPAPSPAPLPGAAATSHSSLPKAAIVGGSVAGAVVAVAVISAVAGKVGLSCILAPVLKILTSPFVSAVCTGPCAKLNTLCCNLPCWNCKGNGSDKTGLCAKLASLCSNLPRWNRKKDGSDKPSNDRTEGDPDIKRYVDVLGGHSPEDVTEAETTAAAAYSLAKSPLHDVVKAHSDQIRMSAQSFLTTHVSEFTERLQQELEKQKAMIMQTLPDSLPLQDVVQLAHGDQPGMSAQSFLATQLSDFAEAGLKKQKALIMEPLNQSVMEAQGYFESLCSAKSNASDELKAIKSSAHAYLDEVGKLNASAEDMGKALAIELGAEKIKMSSIATEYAAEMRRLQKLKNEPLIPDEEEVLNRVQAKSSVGGGEAYHQEEASNQYMHINAADVRRGGSMPLVETLSDASKLREEMGAIARDQHGGTDQQYLSSVALVPTTSIAGAQNTLQPEEGPIVPVPTKAITLVPTTTMTTATAKKPKWQLSDQQGKKAKRPTNLGHVSCSCELSAHKFLLFTSCTSGGSYGSPPPSHAGDDPKYHKTNNYIEMQELDAERNNNKGEVFGYNNSTLAPLPISYGGNNHVGLLTSSSAPIKHHYIANAQYLQPPSHPITSLNTSTTVSNSHRVDLPNTLTIGSNSHAPSDYGNPFDGVL